MTRGGAGLAAEPSPGLLPIPLALLLLVWPHFLLGPAAIPSRSLCVLKGVGSEQPQHSPTASTVHQNPGAVTDPLGFSFLMGVIALSITQVKAKQTGHGPTC